MPIKKVSHYHATYKKGGLNIKNENIPYFFMTIQEIIKKLNYLEDNAKFWQKTNGAQSWLNEVNKMETLFCNHPDADKTCTYKGRLVMKNSVSLEQLGYSKESLKRNGLK